MKLFSWLYNKMILWSSHRHAPYYLAAVSFTESSFFPIPPDVMLISMGLAKPHQAWRYAFITTIFSVLGGIFGYCIGMYAITLLQPWLMTSSLEATYEQVLGWFQQYGIWIIFIAAFISPIPYKLFTIAAGALHMAFLPFVLISWLGRGARFYIVSSCMYFFGERLHDKIQRYIDHAAWVLLLLFIILFIAYKLTT